MKYIPFRLITFNHFWTDPWLSMLSILVLLLWVLAHPVINDQSQVHPFEDSPQFSFKFGSCLTGIFIIANQSEPRPLPLFHKIIDLPETQIVVVNVNRHIFRSMEMKIKFDVILIEIHEIRPERVSQSYKDYIPVKFCNLLRPLP